MLQYLIIDVSPGGTPVPIICTDDPRQARTTFERVLTDEIRTISKEAYLYQIPSGRVCLAGEMNTRTGPTTWGPFKQLCRATRKDADDKLVVSHMDPEFAELAK